MAMSPSPHLVLARKWRPETFAELAGQEHVTRTMVRALTSGRIAHAFLFAGIRGVGKTTAARILARCLNCANGPTPEPCGQCAACVEIRAGRAIDVSEIDGATYRKIDDARAIIENLSYRPARDRFKIYIIDEAHQLTDQAFNALLKTLEEPPEHVKFILATTEPQKMPETILSRLQRYDFRRIPFATILARLIQLAERENIDAEAGALRLIGREAGGSMRDAERMLESAIASADGKIIEDEVAAALGVASRTAVLQTAEAILKRDAAAALAGVRELYAHGADLQSFGRDLLEALRNMIVGKLQRQPGARNLFPDLPDHEAGELRRIADHASLRDLMRLFRLMANAQEELLRSPYGDLILEVAVVRMATLAPVMDADELLQALGSAPEPAGTGAPSAPPPAGNRRIPMAGEVKADAPRRAVPAQPAPSARTAPGVTAELPDLRNHIRIKRAALAGFMEQGASLAMSGDVITMTPRNEIYIHYLNDNRNVIGELASELYGRRMRVELAAVGETASPAAHTSQAVPAAPSEQLTNTSNDRETKAGAETAYPGPDAVTAKSGPSSGNNAEREKIYADPVVRGIFDKLEARLVEVRETPPPHPEAPHGLDEDDSEE